MCLREILFQIVKNLYGDFSDVATVREVSEEVGICKSSCHTILTEKLKMYRVAAKFVPRLLTEEQKQNGITVSQELLDRSNTD